MADVEPTTASPQSCFWAIVALALNSALQPAGELCGIISNPAYRISPLLQVVNAFSTLARLIYETIQCKGRVREATGAVARQNRLYDVDSASTAPAAPKPSRQFRAIVFFVGILPQAIKILAVQGDIVSRVLALSYAVPFIMLELVDWFGTPPPEESGGRGDSEDSEGLGTVHAFSFILFWTLHLSTCVCLVTILFAKYLFGHFIDANSVICFTVAVIFSLFILPFAIADNNYQGMAIILSFGCFFSLVLYHKFRYALLCGVLFVLAVKVAQVIFAHPSWEIYRYVRSSDMSDEDIVQMQLSVLAGSWGAAWVVLYYTCFYDASVTYKPDWTKWLG